jgi:hypothetical protein
VVVATVVVVAVAVVVRLCSPSQQALRQFRQM